MNRKASSQASWALLAQGVNEARVEAHKATVFVNQLVDGLKKTDVEDKVYELAGDTLVALPKTLLTLVQALDRTNYALIKLGDNFYRQRLSQDDRETVDLTSKYSPIPAAAKRVATLYLHKKG